jgi:4-alpha-glucanotransferase
MNIKFNINYKTNWGQVLKIVGSIPQLGINNADNAIVMLPQNGDNGDWELIVKLPDDFNENIEYKYFIEDNHTKLRFFEWGNKRTINNLYFKSKEVIISDFWRSTSEPDNTFYSSAFTNILFNRTKKKKANDKPQDSENFNIAFKINLLRIDPSHIVGITGNIKELGEWDKKKVVSLHETDFPEWETNIVLKKNQFPIIYKYCIVDSKSKEVVFEETEDRIMYVGEKTLKNKSLIRTDEKFKFPRAPWKAAGVAIPVFSLRSKNGLGVGEFLDLKLLIDWAKKTGMKLVQILPINDTVAHHSWIDSYPYSAISVFALHPIYLNLQTIGKLSSKITQEIVDEQRTILNSKEKIDYDAVMKIKSRFYKLIYDEQRDKFLNNTDFKKFFKENKDWLIPYATFSYLRDLFGTPDFKKWGRFSKPDQKILAEITNPEASHYDDIAVHYFIQYHLHIQLLDVSDYARKNGIVLKGDIPIGIFRNSVDAWLEPRLYNMDAQAGAPPDDFSVKGQNWRFPTYNWGEMAKDDFKWWKDRMKQMSDYFDAFRIDHILGFFRIWEMPECHVEGLLGHFNPSLPVYKNEMYEKGIPFDFYRFCTPFIRDYMLFPIFGDLTQFIKDNYLIEYEYGKFYIRPEFDTQRKVEDSLNFSPSDTQTERIKKERIKNGMFNLISEVLFIEVQNSDGEAFTPRHSLYKTNSFNEFNGDIKHKIMELYNDYFFKRNEEFWKQQALVKLPAIKNATNMLICGEDLGMVPKCVSDVMKNLGILSLEVQRMPKDTNIEFGHPNRYPYLSVATPSSHDTSTIRGWWEEDPARSQRFYTQILGKDGGSPFYCEPWLVRDIIIQHLYSPSMWVIFPIQDLLGIDAKLRLQNAKEERINNPANPEHYWRYRMHLYLEDLLEETEFNDKLLAMHKECGRYFNY